MCLKNGRENTQIRVTILRCFTSWITVHAIPLQAVPSSDVVAYALQVNGFETYNELQKKYSSYTALLSNFVF